MKKVLFAVAFILVGVVIGVYVSRYNISVEKKNALTAERFEEYKSAPLDQLSMEKKMLLLSEYFDRGEFEEALKVYNGIKSELKNRPAIERVGIASIVGEIHRSQKRFQEELNLYDELIHDEEMYYHILRSHSFRDQQDNQNQKNELQMARKYAVTDQDITAIDKDLKKLESAPLRSAP